MIQVSTTIRLLPRSAVVDRGMFNKSAHAYEMQEVLEEFFVD